MNTNNKNIYRLVKPYQSTKVYEASTIMHGAGKCHKELKKSNIMCDTFTIMDINNKSFFNFNIKPKNEMILKNDPTELLNQEGGVGGDELTQIKQELSQLKYRLDNLENQSKLKTN